MGCWKVAVIIKYVFGFCVKTKRHSLYNGYDAFNSATHILPGFIPGCVAGALKEFQKN